MPAGHSTGSIPEVRIVEDDFGSSRVGVFTARDGIIISGYLEDSEGNTIRDPVDNNQPFKLRLGIEDWAIALDLGASLIDAALQLRMKGLQDIQMAERNDSQSALLSPPDPDHDV